MPLRKVASGGRQLQSVLRERNAAYVLPLTLECSTSTSSLLQAGCAWCAPFRRAPFWLAPVFRLPAGFDTTPFLRPLAPRASPIFALLCSCNKPSPISSCPRISNGTGCLCAMRRPQRRAATRAWRHMLHARHQMRTPWSPHFGGRASEYHAAPAVLMSARQACGLSASLQRPLPHLSSCLLVGQ